MKTMTQSQCDIVVLSWNNLAETKKFVKSLKKNTSIDVRVIIIDNASTDETPTYLKSLEDTENCHFQIIYNQENVGFVRGMNQGMALCSAPYICVANNDILFTKNWLNEIISVFDNNQEIGILNPNSNNMGTPLAKDQTIESLGEDLQTANKNHLVETPFCIGFCMVIKRELYEKIGVGGFSEDFIPMFFEDTDYSLKAQQAGFHCGIAKGSYVWHKEHASVDQLGKKKEEYFEKSRQTFYDKWGKTLRIAWVLADDALINDHLSNGIEVARLGNFVSFLVIKLKRKREQIFRENKKHEFSEVKFFSFFSIFGIIWKILVKKKKYDIIISDHFLMKTICKICNIKNLANFNKDEIMKYKKNEYRRIF